ncbi:MAG TPA: hypothetical protein VFQ12_01800 [Thermoleophilaceae bacterium]|nr:hypothetical protein [Thermoleophilaceae bacterium]
MRLIADSSATWLILLAPLAVAATLVGLGLYLRGGPSTAHGNTVRTTPRARHEVPGWALTLLWPFFTYDYHRRAYVLRGIGHRLGPVLRRRRPGPLPQVRTGRFDRVPPQPEEARAAAGAVARAPVGARGKQPEGAPSGDSTGAARKPTREERGGKSPESRPG